MENSFQAYHRGGYGVNCSDRMRNSSPIEESEGIRVVPNLIMRESELLYMTDPEKLLREYMKLRNWEYKLDVAHDGGKFKAVVEIDSEDAFTQCSNSQKKALIKVIICVIYHYNSMLASIWIARHQNILKDLIR
ncbi:hypothetical protein SteCoe_3449 [Stentor coeruleus]|uniref:Uncharacterized protein n=1 Tax=Stentor coeruleus TaxID=5963 RepID=A0A1R2CX74_9CILI|nr:hypothetical protein SteCoe_3449 [Stentor coeruleus]